jgi:hypothetical protein
MNIIYLVALMELMTLDIAFTYVSLRLYRKYKPKDKTWYEFERNPIISWLFKTFGLNLGTVIGFIFTTSLMFIIGINVEYESVLIILGMYTLLFYIHVGNVVMLLTKKSKLKILRDP